MAAKEKPRYWWWFKPITGLDISDPETDLTNLIFSDASILSSAALLHHIKSGKFKGKKMFIDNIKGKMASGKYDAWIGVRRLLIDPDKPEVETEAADRKFRIISAAIGAVCLVDSRCQYSCCPADEVSHRISDYVATDENRERCVTGWKIPHIVSFSRAHWNLSRPELESMIDQSSLLNAVQIATGYRAAQYSDSVVTTVSVAMRRLALSLIADQPGEIVLACWSVFEILLSTGENTPHDRVKGRCKFLVAPEVVERMERLYALRNAWVHRGEEPPRAYMHDFVASALDTLRAFSGLAAASPAGATKQNILEWLDLNLLVASGQPLGGLAKMHQHFAGRDPLKPGGKKLDLPSGSLFE